MVHQSNPFSDLSPLNLKPARLTKIAAIDRTEWQRNRKQMEASQQRSGVSGQSTKHWYWFEKIVKWLYFLLKISGLHRRFYRNAISPKLRTFEAYFETLPHEFQFYRILHLTDLHLDLDAKMAEGIKQAVQGLSCDLVLLTGDYQHQHGLDPQHNQAAMANILSLISSRDGMVAVLGNHDSHRVAAIMEGLGCHVLTNETLVIERAEARIHITGLDDVHYFYSEQSTQALTHGGLYPGFKIAAVHSPEMALEAAQAGFDLYLCGHTHGGQVCLPFGIPLITHADVPRRFVRGFWHQSAMIGFTNKGCGSSALPLRANCPGEVVMITLRKGRKMVI